MTRHKVLARLLEAPPLGSIRPGRGGGGFAMFLGLKSVSLGSHIFGFKICKHELPIFVGKNFQQLLFSLGYSVRFSYVIPQK